MANSASIANLRDALKLVQDAVKKLERETSTAAPPPAEVLRKLSEVVRELGQPKPVRPPRCPEEYLKQWKEVVSGARQDIDPRAVRFLCWKPEASTTVAFQDFLDRKHSGINGLSLQGLIESCHARWDSKFAAGEVVKRVKARLDGYAGPNRLLQKWKPASAMILGPKAHESFGEELLRQGSRVVAFCESWGISDVSSHFVQMGIESATDICTDQADHVPEMRKLLFKELLQWPGWVTPDLRKALSRLILLPTSSGPELIEPIAKFVLRDRRFGDPRLPQKNINWIGIEPAARRVREWLSSADITFFFEHVLPDRKDPHGRKAFWLRYVGCRGLVSRPLLNDIDRLRLRQVLRERKEQAMTFGTLEGNTSAFLLDFGSVLVVEFSAVGNACYVYDKRIAAKIVPDLWTPKTFSISDLKVQRLAVHRMVHNRRQHSWRARGWQEEMQSVLARHGVRPLS